MGDALVSGFMMTHNVKVDAATPDQPTWFFKGLGDRLKLSGEPLAVPGDAVAVCEEAEIVLVYVGDATTGRPRYAGHTFGNDLTDIGRFKQHNGHLSYAKLCDAAISPPCTSAHHPPPSPAARRSNGTVPLPGRAPSPRAPTPCTTTSTPSRKRCSPTLPCTTPAASTTSTSAPTAAASTADTR
ncbi:hypothetical protein OIM90_32165 [Streptomyces sp. AD16]|nr:hypothetical protein OIM90_32165 [Streptomyces sp. AD16]